MSKDDDKKMVPQDRVMDYSAYTKARLGLGHTGGHLRAASWLDFQSGFAQAKDAVFSQFDVLSIANLCNELALANIEVHSQATDILQFLSRPDLGRLLGSKDAEHLRALATSHADYCNQDILILISGGLSPIAIQHQIPKFLPALIKQCKHMNWTLAPVMINPRGRVALGDALNAIFNAKVVMVLIGERPGLTTPDSLGIYFTYAAKPGCTDAMRNCISNIHDHGLGVEQALADVIRLISLAMQKKISGIGLNIHT